MNLSNGLIIAGMHSSGGKTAVTSMLLAALRKRSIATQPFKVGPDYIDPGYHFHYSGTRSVNLDSWIMGREHILTAAQHFTENAFGIAEGVMGLFDGSEPTNDSGSTMEIARWLRWPILLVVPCRNAGRSITAAVQGFLAEAAGTSATEGPEFFAGVLLNQVNSESHAEYLRKACVSLEIPVLGALPEIPELRRPERHLGLQPGVEQNLPQTECLAESAEKYLDIELLCETLFLAQKHTKTDKKESAFIRENLRSKPQTANLKPRTLKLSKRIAVAQDEAFHFYYIANLEWLREQGAEVVFFSLLHDTKIPENVDGLILGGGFPEVFAETISANQNILTALKNAVASEIPCYAECGGLMVLTEALKLQSGQNFPMAGVIPGIVEMTKSLQNFGYCKINSSEFGEIRGHEFHYSRWSAENELAGLWEVTRHSTGIARKEGYRTANLHASYVHLYFPQAASLIRKILHL